MLHMKGPSGKVAYTRSVALILAGAGLCSVEEAQQVARNQDVKMKPAANTFQTQGRRGQGQGRPRRQQQLTPFQLATQNRFGGLQDFCYSPPGRRGRRRKEKVKEERGRRKAVVSERSMIV